MKKDCFGHNYTQLRKCITCQRITECGELWGENARKPVRKAHSYLHGVGDPSPWYENVVRDMER